VLLVLGTPVLQVLKSTRQIELFLHLGRDKIGAIKCIYRLNALQLLLMFLVVPILNDGFSYI
jgi:hypothetical protein